MTDYRFRSSVSIKPMNIMLVFLRGGCVCVGGGGLCVCACVYVCVCIYVCVACVRLK